MSGLSKKTRRAAKKSTRRTKMLISAAALSVTFGGWIAMANSDSSSAFLHKSPAPMVSTGQADSQASTQSVVDSRLVDGAPASSAQPPAPLTMTSSSR